MKRIVIALSILAGLFISHPAHAQAPTKVWAFCGVHPDAANAHAAVSALAFSGITATFGPCMPPDWSSYTTSNPGQRYVDPATYERLVVLNASVGLSTVVYDARMWSDDPQVRATAVALWEPHRADIAAFDMGDEFDPKTPDWAVLVHRWALVVKNPLGIAPYTNHLADISVLSQALRDLPGSILSYDSYTEDANGVPNDTLTLARAFDSQTPDLMCAVNAMPFNDHNPNWYHTARNMWLMRFAGCDSYLIFGGVQPYGPTLDITDPQFGPSLVNGMWPTALGFGVRLGTL